MSNSQDSANLTIEAALKQLTRRRPTRAPVPDPAHRPPGGGDERSLVAAPAELILRAAGDARQAAHLLDDLVLSFER
jgi:hypothetical protein